LNGEGDAEVVWSIECNSTALTTGEVPPESYENMDALYNDTTDIVVAVASYSHSGTFGNALNIGELLFNFQEFAPYRPRTFDQYPDDLLTQVSYC